MSRHPTNTPANFVLTAGNLSCLSTSSVCGVGFIFDLSVTVVDAPTGTLLVVQPILVLPAPRNSAERNQFFHHGSDLCLLSRKE